MAETSTTNDSIPWLIMIYMAGDNSLSEDMVLALQDLMAVGPPKGDRIVAQFDPAGVGLSSQRYVFGAPIAGTTRSTAPEGLERYRDATFNPLDTNTGDRRDLVAFVKWAIKHHSTPDTRYLLVLSGHGSGVTDDFFLTDASSADSMTIQELRLAVTDIARSIRRKSGNPERKLDVLGLDACFMALGEIACEVRKHVDILVAAEGAEPEFGWPYGKILEAARSHRDHNQTPIKPTLLAETIVEQYVGHYADFDRSAGRSVDLAALDLEGVEEVIAAFSDLVSLLPGTEESAKPLHDQVLLAHWYAQTYKFDQFVDLKDFCEQLIQQRPNDAPLEYACGRVISALERTVILSGCSGFAQQFSHGFSVYFPWGVVSPDYDDYQAFAKATGWHRFLHAHIDATRRSGSRYGHQPTLRAARRSLPKALVEFRRARLESVKQRYPKVASQIEADIAKALDVQATRIQQADILEVDCLAEFGGRIERVRGIDPTGTSRFEKKTRFEDKTRFENKTRSINSRERWVKNLPPAIGVAYWPKQPPSKRAAAGVRDAALQPA